MNLKRNDTQIVFIDQQASDGSATNILAALKDDSAFALIPVVVVTSYTDSNEVIEAMRLGPQTCKQDYKNGGGPANGKTLGNPL